MIEFDCKAFEKITYIHLCDNEIFSVLPISDNYFIVEYIIKNSKNKSKIELILSNLSSFAKGIITSSFLQIFKS